MSDEMLIPVVAIRNIAAQLMDGDIYVKFEEISDQNNIFLVTVFYEIYNQEDSQERYYVATSNGIAVV